MEYYQEIGGPDQRPEESPKNRPVKGALENREGNADDVHPESPLPDENTPHVYE